MSSTVLRNSLVSAALFAAIAGAPTLANAADLLMDPVIQAPEIVTQSAGGWYLRGDITYDVHSMDNPMYSFGNTEVTYRSAELENSFDVGLGIGYQINENFRVDLTGEYVFSADFSGVAADRCSLVGDIPGKSEPNPLLALLDCDSADTSSYSAFKLLANAYVDLGNFSGFTPYVGAGLGGAYVKWDGLEETRGCIACGLTTSTKGGTESWRFAYALHAGFSYDIAQSTKLDLGYSFSRITGGEMFQWSDGSGAQGYDKGIDSHVFRAGIRYEIW